MKMMRMKIRTGVLAELFFAVALTGCGNDDIIGPGENEAPTAVIAANPTSVPAGDNNQTIVTLDASGSFDPDGDPLSYTWSAPSVTFENGTSASDQVAQVSFPGAAPYLVTLEVRDGQGGSGTAETTIELGQVQQNSAPIASFTTDPGAIPAGDGNETIVILDASGSSDPDGDELSFQWEIESVTFENGTGVTDAIVEVTFPGAAPYAVALTVTDTRGASDSAEGVIDLLEPAPNAAPSAAIETSHTEIPPGDGNQTIVTLDGSNSSDPDGDELTFKWSVQGATFENGTSDTDEVVEVSFPGVADYNVSLVVDDGNGNTDEAKIVLPLGS